jgi:hypothetical protein
VKSFALPILALTLCSGSIAQAQFGGLSLPGKSSKPAADPSALLDQGMKLMIFTTLASDLAYDGSMKLLSAYPPKVVAKIQALAEKVNEAKKKRNKEGNMDASEVEAVSAFEKGMAELDAQWDQYQKDPKLKGKVTQAHAKLGLMTGADALAALQIPGFLTNAQATLKDLGSNPAQLGKIQQLSFMVKTLTVVAKQIPDQKASVDRIQNITGKISKAEHFTMGEPPKVTTTDPEALKKAAQSTDVEG